MYRIRQSGLEEKLDYIGETGRTLRERILGSLVSGLESEVVPYRDPHTAAPRLSALRRESGREFEVLTTVYKESPQMRKGLECLLPYE